jgi:hypothetical protein
MPSRHDAALWDGTATQGGPPPSLAKQRWPGPPSIKPPLCWSTAQRVSTSAHLRGSARVGQRRSRDQYCGGSDRQLPRRRVHRCRRHPREPAPTRRDACRERRRFVAMSTRGSRFGRARVVVDGCVGLRGQAPRRNGRCEVGTVSLRWVEERAQAGVQEDHPVTS